MKRPVEIAHEEASMSTLVEITSVFEGIASMRIAQTKSRVIESTKFFNELWHIYSQLRVDTIFNFGREDENVKIINKELYIIVTAEGGFSGDIDLKLVELMLKTYDAAKHDVIVIGHHGAVQLALRGVQYEKYFKLPTQDQNINVAPITQIVKQYKATTVFYQEYVSL